MSRTIKSLNTPVYARRGEALRQDRSADLATERKALKVETGGRDDRRVVGIARTYATAVGTEAPRRIAKRKRSHGNRR